MRLGRICSRLAAVLASLAAPISAWGQSAPPSEAEALMTLSVETASREVGASVPAQDTRRRAAAAGRAVRSHHSKVVVRAAGEKGPIEYRGEFMAPDRYHVTRAVVPEGDMDEWITIGEDVYISLGIGWVRLGSEPAHLQVSQSHRAQSLLVRLDRYIEVLESVEPISVAAYRYHGVAMIVLEYDTKSLRGIEALSGFSNSPGRLEIWIDSGTAVLKKGAIRAEVDGRAVEMIHVFTNHNGAIRIVPPVP